MKRLIWSLLSLTVLLGWFATPVRAQQTSYRWYCKHVKDHKQPPIAGELAFVEEHGGYYIDHKHSDASDAEKVIYLTFDAGYENGNVSRVLDVLREEEVPAAFFVLGHLITKNTELIQRMANEGHLICNHTVRHKDMSNVDEETFLSELAELETLCKEHADCQMANYYRPPEGTFSQENLVFAEKNGYKTIFWSFAYPDWDNQRQIDPEKAKAIILDNLHNGEVMLLHPTSATNAAILGDVIRECRAQGYRFGTLDELVVGEYAHEGTPS